MTDFSRRDVMAGLAAAGVMVPGAAFASDPVIPQTTLDARKNAPVVPRKVNRLYNLKATIDQPNDMQFAANGDLWILDQKDPNKVFTINPTTGAVLAGPAPRPLDRFAITVQDGQIIVDTTQRFTAPSPG